MVGERETGNERYIVNLLRGFQAQAAQHTHSFCMLAAHPQELRRHLCIDERFYLRKVPASPFVRIPFVLPRQVSRIEADVLHVTYIASPFQVCPTVVSVHDISFALFPEHFSLRDKWVLSTLVPLTARRAARVVTLSECSRRDLIDRYRLPAEKVVVIPIAPDEQFAPITDETRLAQVRRKYQTGSRFILSVGNLEPRKNLARLIEAFAMMCRVLDGEIKLVIAGQSHWRASGVLRKVTQLGLENDVVFAGYVPDDDLVMLYNAAALFVYPSLYEGFGLPVLEAMACGTPVVCSNSASLPEVVGAAALKVDPQDVLALATQIARVLQNASLAMQLKKAGLQHSAQFTWAETARRTLDVYRDAVYC